MPATDNQQTRLRHGTPHLLSLLMALSTTLACQRPHDDTLPWNSLQLLEIMAPNPTEPCQHQQPSFFPDALQHNHHPHQAPLVALRILQNLFHTFSSNHIPQQWEAQARHDLLNSLQHYIQHLKQCLPAQGMLFKRHGPHNLMLHINKYFRRIHDFLRIHNHSNCAWDHIRLEARLCFKNVDKLFRQMKSQAAPALHQTHSHQTPIPTQRWWPQMEQRLQQPRLGLLSTAHTSSSQAPATMGKRA